MLPDRFSKKNDFANFDDKLKNSNKKGTSNKTKHVLIENELKKLETFNLGLFIGEITLIMIDHKIT